MRGDAKAVGLLRNYPLGAKESEQQRPVQSVRHPWYERQRGRAARKAGRLDEFHRNHQTGPGRRIPTAFKPRVSSRSVRRPDINTGTPVRRNVTAAQGQSPTQPQLHQLLPESAERGSRRAADLREWRTALRRVFRSNNREHVGRAVPTSGVTLDDDACGRNAGARRHGFRRYRRHGRLPSRTVLAHLGRPGRAGEQYRCAGRTSLRRSPDQPRKGCWAP